MSQRPADVLYKELEGFVLVFTGMVNALCLCKNRICNRLYAIVFTPILPRVSLEVRRSFH